MLTSFVSYNASNPTDLCYPEFPLHFIFNKNMKWQPRKNASHVVSRMYSVSPKDIECYCLRLLLLHASGPTCFDDLLIVDSHRCSSVHEACLLRHLLSDDNAWEHTLQEATTFCMPSQLRDLFVTICLHCDPFNAFELWENHKDAMIEDFIHQIIDPQLAEQLALQHFEHVLKESDMSCSDLGWLDWVCLTTTHVLQDILAVLHRLMCLKSCFHSLKSCPIQVNVSQSCFHSLNNYSSLIILSMSGG